MKAIKLPHMDCATVSREIGDFVIDTVLAVGATGCVVGLSGGVDSSTTAALINRAFAEYNRQDAQRLELVGYILPSSVNKMEDAGDAQALAKAQGIRYEIHSIEKLVEAFKSSNPEAFEKNYHRGNLISRVRANVLSTKSATEHKILAGTGNRDENFGIGYYTLFGDGAVHLSPIAGLSKRLVREMALFLGVDETIVNHVPTAGLADLAGFSHIFILYHFHLSKKFSLKVKPFPDDQKRGLFATRAPARPNPIGLSVVRLISITESNLKIQDVDVVDRTPPAGYQTLCAGL